MAVRPLRAFTSRRLFAFLVLCMSELDVVLREDDRRVGEIGGVFDPLTGEGSVGERFVLTLPDFVMPKMWLPVEMKDSVLVTRLRTAGSVGAFLAGMGLEATTENRDLVAEAMVRVRVRYDFAFWSYLLARIKNKDGGDDIPFRLNRPQRRLVEELETMRKAGKPIRLILLKARQWGGSTCVEMYMAWIQLVLEKGKNSIIVAQVKEAAYEVKDMFMKLMGSYRRELLVDEGETPDEREPLMCGVGNVQNISKIPLRNCKIKIGSAENPDTARGADSALAHLTEVAFWKKTDNKSPEDIVRSVCSGISLQPLTMIVYESTANGTGNFFQTEYDDAKAGRSNFRSLFVAWWQIERYSETIADREGFARWLIENKANANTMDNRHESGRYLWRLWEMGATLEAINWYVGKRTEYTDHADMAAEYPSDDVEAFKHSGQMVFDVYKVEPLRKDCRGPRWVGDVCGLGMKGRAALDGLKFEEDRQGLLWVWQKPELFDGEKVMHRYLVVVDIGGRSSKADWSVIVVFDRYYMMEGGRPTVVAQWYGHVDHDLLAWKAAQVAAWYDNALLVIESNTLETKDKDRDVDADQSGFILNQIKDVYDNLYARKGAEEDIKEGGERKYGFHTNTKTKPEIISLLVEVVRERLYVERDVRCLDELLTYEKRQNGSYGAAAGKHDDLLMTRAIGMWVCYRQMETPYFVKVGGGGVRREVVSEASF